MERYSVITQKNKREIVLLRGSGCAYRRCAFCDYHFDCCAGERENFRLNKSVLDRVTGALGNPICPLYIDNSRIDIQINNNDFGVGDWI